MPVCVGPGRKPKLMDFSCGGSNNHQGPVVQSIVSLPILLIHKFVKQISAKVTKIHCYFLLKKCENPLHCKGFSHFSTKNNSVFVILMFEIFNETLTNDVVSFEQLGPGKHVRVMYNPLNPTFI